MLLQQQRKTKKKLFQYLKIVRKLDKCSFDIEKCCLNINKCCLNIKKCCPSQRNVAQHQEMFLQHNKCLNSNYLDPDFFFFTAESGKL